MVAALTRALEAKDPFSRGHSARVTALAEAVALHLAWDERRLAALRIGGLLHDVGKLTLSAALLAKRGPLSASERAEFRNHPAAGARLLAAIPAARVGLPCVLYHHERWDGRGYPTARAGAAIPIEARLLAVADAFDAMTSPRAYRSPLEPLLALEELARCAGTQFDPLLARTSVEVWSAMRTASAA